MAQSVKRYENDDQEFGISTDPMKRAAFEDANQ